MQGIFVTDSSLAACNIILGEAVVGNSFFCVKWEVRRKLGI